MFSNRKSKKEVNKIQERYLRLVINNYDLSNKEHLHLTNEISLQQRCLNSVMIEIYNFLNGLSPDIMHVYLQFRNTGTILYTITFL